MREGAVRAERYVTRDDLPDPLYQQMVEAFLGNAEPWRSVNVGLRDAIVDFAGRHCPYYRNIIRPGEPFEEIPLLTKTIIRERFEDLLAEGVPESRRVAKRTSGSSGEALEFYRDRSQGPIEDYSAQRFLRRLHAVPEQA